MSWIYFIRPFQFIKTFMKESKLCKVKSIFFGWNWFLIILEKVTAVNNWNGLKFKWTRKWWQRRKKWRNLMEKNYWFCLVLATMRWLWTVRSMLSLFKPLKWHSRLWLSILIVTPCRYDSKLASGPSRKYSWAQTLHTTSTTIIIFQCWPTKYNRWYTKRN